MLQHFSYFVLSLCSKTFGTPQCPKRGVSFGRPPAVLPLERGSTQTNVFYRHKIYLSNKVKTKPLNDFRCGGKSF